MNIEYDRWVELLKLTAQDNNWKHLHIRFQTDNSYYREMKDYIDHVLNEFDEDDDDHKHVKESVDRNANVWKAFCESASVNFVKQWLNDPKMRPSKYDIKQFQLLFIRSAKQDTFRTLPLEADWDLLLMMADLHKKNVDMGIPLDKAFALGEDPVGRPTNPYETPECIVRMVNGMVWGYMTQAEVIRAEIENPKTPSHHIDHYKKLFAKYKWTALNNYLTNRFYEGDSDKLDENEREAINKYWDNVVMPEALEIYPNFVQRGIGRLGGKGGKKTVTAEVIKANKNLH